MRFNKLTVHFLLVVLCLFVVRSKAQDEQLEYLGVSDGLSQGMIIHMIQDRDGLLWMATKDGLNRYDGYEFKVYSHSPDDPYSISDHTQQYILEDSRGWIWVATERHGLDIYVKSQDRFYHLPGRSGNTGPKNKLVHVMTEDGAGNIWLGTESGLEKVVIPKGYEFNKETKEVLGEDFKMMQVAPLSLGVTSLLLQNNMLYFANNMEVFQLDTDGETLSSLPVLKLLESNTEPLQGVLQLFKDKYGHFWFVKPHSIIWYDGVRTKLHMLPTTVQMPRAGVLIDSSENAMIVGTNSLSKYLLKQDGSVEIEEMSDLGTLYCNNIIRDHSGIYWLGTNGFGVIKYNPQKRSLGHLIKGNSIYHIHEDRNGNTYLWYNHDLYQLDAVNNRLFKPSGIPVHLMKSRVIYQDRSGVYWFHLPNESGSTEMISWDPRSRQEFRYSYQGIPNNMSPIFEDNSGRVWIGTMDGKLHSFARGQPDHITLDLRQISDLSDKEILIKTIVQDNKNVFWVGTIHGLVRFRYQDANLLDYRLYQRNKELKYSLSENYILHIALDELDDQVVWIGTKGGGLNRYDKETDRFSAITTKDGLPNNVVYGILQNKGQLWMSTNRGLAVYTPKENTIFNYTSREGLQDDEFNSYSFCKTKDGTLIFGGVNGVNVFRPEEVIPNKVPPNIIITLFEVNNRPYPMPIISGFSNQEPRVELSHTENLLTFQFSALDFTAPKKNRYRYKLSGSNEEWVDIGSQNKVTFTDMKPGKYTFYVQGTNNSGLWSEGTAGLHIHIRSPWWLTTWAYLFYIALAVIAILVLYRFQINRIKLHSNLIFERKETERLMELDKIKTNFFSNITHEFRTPLTLILEPIRQLIPELKDDKHISKLTLAEKNSNHLLHLVNQLLDLSKLEGGFMELEASVGDVVEVFQSTEGAFRPLADKRKVNLHFEVPEGPVLLEFDRNKLDLILNNLLSNAIKFTPAQGRVICSLRVEEYSESTSKMVISVIDTGPGIPAEALDRIFDRFYQVDSSITRQSEGTGIGLALTKELVELMNGEIQVSSAVGEGSVFKVVLTARKGAYADNIHIHPPLQETGYKPAIYNEDRTLTESEVLDAEQEIILVVEDNEDLRHFICDSLRPRYHVMEAVNGEDGIARAIEVIPDLIISDLMMPLKDGFELCSILKENTLTSHIPIIILTAKSAMDSKLKGLSEGADDYLTKPFHTEELHLRIHNLIESRRKLRMKYAQEGPTLNKEAAYTSGPGIIAANDEVFLSEVRSYITDNLDKESFTIDDFAQLLFISRTQLYRKLKALTDMSPSEFVRNHRLDVARELLEQKAGNVNEISIRVGIPNRSYFSRMFKARFGILPSEIE